MKQIPAQIAHKNLAGVADLALKFLSVLVKKVPDASTVGLYSCVAACPCFSLHPSTLNLQFSRHTVEWLDICGCC